MTDDECLDEAIRRTGVARYRHLCSDANVLPPPNAPADWRRHVRAIAEGPLPAHFPTIVGSTLPTPPLRRPPPLATQAANLAGAVGRVVGAAVRGEAVLVPAEVRAARRAICLPCEFNGAGPAAVRCLKCGCGPRKLELATERCPLDPPRWDRFPATPPSSPT